jgi:3-oxoacyl-[acyl-carrier protein] reductase
MLLNKKSVVITGSNRGIGRKILETFSENGANIFACTRKIEPEFKNYINEKKKIYNNEIIPVELNLEDEGKIKEGTKKILDYNMPIDIIVNNAGIISTSLFQMTSTKKLKEMFNINFFSHSLLNQYLLKSMIKIKKGSIIYISSSSALDGNEGRSAYASSKAAMISEAKVLSRELGIYNIRVNSIAPGLTNTDMMVQNHSKDLITETIKNISLKRICDPSEVANVALFLASDLSSYITGQVIRVDGGMK